MTVKLNPVYLWWVEQVEGMVQSEVDEPQQSGVHFCESRHYSVVDICWVLKEQSNTIKLNLTNGEINNISANIYSHL